MATQHSPHRTNNQAVFPLEPYARVTPSPDPTIVCRVVIPGAAVVCTRIVSRGTRQLPSLPARGRETPGHPS